MHECWTDQECRAGQSNKDSKIKAQIVAASPWWCFIAVRATICLIHCNGIQYGSGCISQRAMKGFLKVCQGVFISKDASEVCISGY